MQKATNKDIETVINNFISKNEMFSNYDVTKKMRSAGFHVMHADVKTVVAAYDYPYNYDAKTITVKGSPAIIHYPDHMDTSFYNPDAIPEPNVQVTLKKVTIDASGAVVSKTTAPVGVSMFHPSVMKPQASTQKPQTSLTFDKRGRCHIASKYSKLAGFRSGDLVNVNVYDKKITITSPQAYPFKIGADIIFRTAYSVDNHYAIRIVGNTLKTAFDKNDAIKIDVIAGCITLSV